MAQPRFNQLAPLVTGLALMARAAAAEDLTVTAGATLTSNYMSSGVTQSNDNPALQGYVEAESHGFYGGIWTSTVDFGGADNAEIDLYLGYRNDLDSGFSYDLSYYRYLYDASGDCCGEFILDVSQSVGDAIVLRGELAYDPETESKRYEAGLDYAVNDQISLGATYGYAEGGDHYGDIGATYAFNDTMSADLRLHDNSSGDPILVLGVSFDTILLSR